MKINTKLIKVETVVQQNSEIHVLKHKKTEIMNEDIKIYFSIYKVVLTLDIQRCKFNNLFSTILL